MDLKNPLILNGQLDLENAHSPANENQTPELGGDLLRNLKEVIFGTKLALLFPAIPLAMAAHSYNFGKAWIFGLSLLGLAPLAERVSFLTEQIAYFTGPTVGGLLNATCGNATELIIAMFALHQNKIHVLKFSLMGSILSNILLVLGTSLLFGGFFNFNKEQRFNTRVAGVSCLMLVVGLVSQMVPLMFKYGVVVAKSSDVSMVELSRVCSILMLLAYVAYVFFHLQTHQFSAMQQEVILLDITMGIALGSAAQISMFVVPLSVIVGWCMGIRMDLDFGLIETGSLALSIIITIFILQDGSSHYLKGVVLCLCYVAISACFFVQSTPQSK